MIDKLGKIFGLEDIKRDQDRDTRKAFLLYKIYLGTKKTSETKDFEDFFFDTIEKLSEKKVRQKDHFKALEERFGSVNTPPENNEIKKINQKIIEKECESYNLKYNIFLGFILGFFLFAIDDVLQISFQNVTIFNILFTSLILAIILALIAAINDIQINSMNKFEIRYCGIKEVGYPGPKKKFKTMRFIKVFFILAFSFYFIITLTTLFFT